VVLGPSVFVRSLSMDEGRKRQRIIRTSKDPVRLRRAIAVLMSGHYRGGPRPYPSPVARPPSRIARSSAARQRRSRYRRRLCAALPGPARPRVGGGRPVATRPRHQLRPARWRRCRSRVQPATGSGPGEANQQRHRRVYPEAQHGGPRRAGSPAVSRAASPPYRIPTPRADNSTPTVARADDEPAEDMLGRADNPPAYQAPAQPGAWPAHVTSPDLTPAQRRHRRRRPRATSTAEQTADNLESEHYAAHLRGSTNPSEPTVNSNMSRLTTTPGNPRCQGDRAGRRHRSRGQEHRHLRVAGTVRVRTHDRSHDGGTERGHRSRRTAGK